jgi:sugar phosphate isomerase/epimerase
MSQSNGRLFTRREAVALGAAAAALPCLPRPGIAGDSQPCGPSLTIGIMTLLFTEYTNCRLAEELAQAGIRTVQLFLNQSDSRYWAYNDRCDVSSMTPKRCRAIAADYRSAGVAIRSIGVYTNLIHPDASERKANLAYFEAMMQIAREMGVRVLMTESGRYCPPKQESEVPYFLQPAVWTQMVDTGKRLADLADRHEVTVALEPLHTEFFNTAKRTRLFIEAIASPRLRVQLDPANLLEVNDLEEMFSQLGPQIVSIHAKDHKMHRDDELPAGQGDIDYLKLVTLVAKHAPQAPLILDYVGPKNYRPALAHLRKALAEAGLSAL